MEDSQERARKLRELTPEKPYDSAAALEERAASFRAESERIQAERAAQERWQRERAERHAALARAQDDEIRAALFFRVMQAREQAKLAEPPPLPPPTPGWRDEQLELEIAAGRRTLAKHAQRSEPAAEKKPEATPGFKT